MNKVRIYSTNPKTESIVPTEDGLKKIKNIIREALKQEDLIFGPDISFREIDADSNNVKKEIIK